MRWCVWLCVGRIYGEMQSHRMNSKIMYVGKAKCIGVGCLYFFNVRVFCVFGWFFRHLFSWGSCFEEHEEKKIQLLSLACFDGDNFLPYNRMYHVTLGVDLQTRKKVFFILTFMKSLFKLRARKNLTCKKKHVFCVIFSMLLMFLL